MEQKCTLQHFTHSHTLYRETSNHYGNLTKEGNPSDEFMCDACYTLGSGARFHCKQCSFDLHEECANCPEYLNTYIHPNHQLELRWEGSIKRDYGKSRPCDICGDQVKGLFYTCSSGAEKRYDDGRHFFFIHPLCSKFPPRVPHGIDKNHPLRFQLVPVIPDSFCAICGDVVFSCSWSYRCDPCGFNIHLECVALPFDDHHSSRSLKDPKAQMHQQKGPVDPPPIYSPYGGYTGTTPVTAPPYNSYYPPTPPPYNYYPYPPPNDTYYYQQPAQPYGYPPTPPPPYYNHHQPHAPPKTEITSSSGDTAPPKKETTSSTHGSKKKRSAKVIGRIAVSLLLSSVLGVVVPMGTT